MTDKHFYADGEPKNGIVASMLDSVVTAIAGMYIDRHGPFNDLDDKQFDGVVFSVAFLMAANLNYKFSYLWCRIQNKRNELEDSIKKAYKNKKEQGK